MIEFEPLSIDVFEREGADLRQVHYEELVLNQEDVKLDMDWDLYKQLEAAGKLLSIGVWEDEILIGYALFTVSMHHLFKGLKYACNVGFVIHPDKRQNNLGQRLMKLSEELLRRMGVKKVCISVRGDSSAQRLLKGSGYTHEEEVLSKLLGD